MKTLFLITLLVCLNIISTFDYLISQNSPVIQVNQETKYDEQSPSLTGLSNGNFVISWYTSTAQTATCPPNCYYNIYFNVYDSTGTRLTDNAILVNTLSSYSSYNPNVKSDGKGGFVIVWEVKDYIKADNIFIRHYDSKFTPGNTIQVNTHEANNNAAFAATVVDQLTGGGYVVVWSNPYTVYNIWAQVLDENLNPVGSNFPVPDVGQNHQEGPFVIGLLNGGFAFCFHTSNWNGSWDVSARIYDRNGVPITNEFMVNVGYTTGIQANAKMAPLKNGNFVITWWDSNFTGNDVFARIYKPDGGTVGQIFQVNSTTQGSQTNSFAVSLSFGGFAIVWQSQSTPTFNIILQIFDENGNKLGQERMINTNTSYNMSTPVITELSNESLLVSWQSSGQIIGSDVWAQIIYKDNGICVDIILNLGKQLLLNIDFTSLSQDFIVLKTLPVNGDLKNDINTSLTLNTFVPKNKVFYSPNKQISDSFSYSTNLVDNPCRVFIIACFTSCLTCSKGGDALNNNCTKCDVNFSAINNKQDGNCYSITQKIDGYYFDSLNDIFTECYPSCLTCSSKGDSLNHNCDSCNKDYYPLEDNTKQCYLAIEVVPGYYFDVLSTKFVRCYSSCAECKMTGFDNYHSCTKCAYNYFPLIDDKVMCYNKDAIVPNYYFDAGNSIFYNCHISCKQCLSPSNSDNPNCTECADGYSTCNGCTKKIFNDNCVDECPSYTIYESATKKCVTCDQDKVLFLNTCIDNCPDGYIMDNLNTCVSCLSMNLFYYSKSCVNECPSNTKLNTLTNVCSDIECTLGYYQEGIGCLTCTDISKIYYNNTCIDICPNNTIQAGNLCQEYIQPISI
jgi:hypothetical protein